MSLHEENKLEPEIPHDIAKNSTDIKGINIKQMKYIVDFIWSR